MEFKVDLRWPTSAALTSDVADVRVYLRDHLLTRLFDVASNQGREYFRASAVRLAFWFADNWWRLRWEPIDDARSPSLDWRMAHEMSSGAGDEAWPPLMLYGVGDRMIVSPSISSGRDDESISYLLDKPLSVDGRVFEDAIDELLLEVIGRCASHEDAGALSALVRQLQAERNHVELGAWRRLEACLGYDPDKAPVDTVKAMVSFEERLGLAAVNEAAIAAPGVGAPAALSKSYAAAAASSVTLHIGEALARTPTPLSSPIPWQAAEQAALNLRNELGLGERLDWANLGDLLSVRWQTLKDATATARKLPFGATLQEQPDATKVALQFGAAYDRRFEIARHIGDAVWTRGSPFGIVSRAKTDRQKFQRAFAQALLVPAGALRRFVDFSRPTERHIEQASRWFEVRPSVVRALLMSKGVLARETLADRLEAA